VKQVKKQFRQFYRCRCSPATVFDDCLKILSAVENYAALSSTTAINQRSPQPAICAKKPLPSNREQRNWRDPFQEKIKRFGMAPGYDPWARPLEANYWPAMTPLVKASPL
jgi:hypothetical protein